MDLLIEPPIPDVFPGNSELAVHPKIRLFAMPPGSTQADVLGGSPTSSPTIAALEKMEEPAETTARGRHHNDRFPEVDGPRLSREP